MPNYFRAAFVIFSFIENAGSIWLEADDATVLHGDDVAEEGAVMARAKCIDRVGQFPMPVDTDFVQLDDSGPIQLAGRRLLDILSTRD